MWQNIIVFAIVGLTATLVAWTFYKKLTGRTSCCGGCAGKDACGSASLRPLNGADHGCGHEAQNASTTQTQARRLP